MMYTIDQVERGLARYMDTELIPKLPHDGIKGFGIGVFATLLVKRGGLMLQNLEHNAMIRDMGIVKDGIVDIDLLAEACKQNIPSGGLTIPVLGMTLRLDANDIDTMRRCIMEV